MAAVSADKIHKDAEVDKLKTDLVEDEKKAAAEKDAAKKKKMDEDNASQRAYYEGIVEAEAAVREAPKLHGPELAAISAIQAAEQKIIDDGEAKQKILIGHGDHAGAKALQPGIDLEYKRMLGKKKAKEIIS
jgi:hypothetical protein